MSQDSRIEWTHHTFNPWAGCTKVSAGCTNCYAARDAVRFPDNRGIWGKDGTRIGRSNAYWNLARKWDRLAEAAGERHRVFCASIADVFEGPDTLPPGTEAFIIEQRMRLFELIDQTPHLDWLLLTKRPENIPDMLSVSWSLSLPDNVWIGTSVEDQAAADLRIPHLLRVPARVRFLSCEPLLGPVNLPMPIPGVMRGFIDWVIVGGESGPGSRPMHPDWARSLRDQCVAAGVPYFFKQWGSWKPISEMDEAEYNPLYEPSKSEYSEEPRRCKVPTRDLQYDGEDGYRLIDGHPGYLTFCVGKGKAGRLLDGRTWDEYPEVAR